MTFSVDQTKESQTFTTQHSIFARYKIWTTRPICFDKK